MSRIRIISAIGCLLAVWNVAAMPDDLSVDAFDRFKETVGEDVDRFLDEEFKDKMNDIEKLSKPFKTGDQVTITLMQGGRKRQISGRFKGIKGTYAEVDERTILLSDIDEIDRQRLSFGNQVQLLQLKINQLRKKLEEDRDRRREIILKERYKQAGYTKKFFDSTAQLGDRFWTYDELGDGKIAVQVSPSERRGYITLEIRNATGMTSSAVMLLRNDPVYSTVVAIEGVAGEDDPEWKQLSFQIPADDLGEDPASEVQRKFRIWIVKKDVGSWYLRPVGERKSSNSGNGDDSVGKSIFTFRIIKSKIEPYTRAYDRELLKLAQAAAEYQGKIDSEVAAMEAKRRAEKEARQREEELRRAEAKEREADRNAALKVMQAIDSQYVWVNAKTAIRRNVEEVSADEVRSAVELDDYNFPTVFGGKPVLQFTNWEKISSRSRVLYSRKYRLLKVNDGGPVYYIQYQVSFVNSPSQTIDIGIELKFKFEGGGTETVKDTFVKVRPSWSGILMGTHKISLEKMQKRIESVELSSDYPE